MDVLEVDSSGEKAKRVKNVVAKDDVNLLRWGERKGELWSRRVERETGRSILSDDLVDY